MFVRLHIFVHPAGSAPHTQGYSGDGPSSPGGKNALGLRGHVQMGPPVPQVDPTMPSDNDGAKTGPQGSSATLPDHDLCSAGFPCQPFSSMGRRDGLQDSQGRGQLFFRITKAFATKKARAVLPVNVEGFVVLPPGSIAYHLWTATRHRAKHLRRWPSCSGHRETRFAPAPRTCVHHRHPRTEFTTRKQVRILLAPAPRVPPLARLLDPGR